MVPHELKVIHRAIRNASDALCDASCALDELEDMLSQWANREERDYPYPSDDLKQFLMEQENSKISIDEELRKYIEGLKNDRT